MALQQVRYPAGDGAGPVVVLHPPQHSPFTDPPEELNAHLRCAEGRRDTPVIDRRCAATRPPVVKPPTIGRPDSGP